MRYKVFGHHTGLRVSELVLGAGTFGTRWGDGAKSDEVRRIVDGYADKAGILAIGNSRKTMVAVARGEPQATEDRPSGSMFSHAGRIWTEASGTYSAAMVSNGPSSLTTTARRFSRNCEA
jgi:hypothetical protein